MRTMYLQSYLEVVDRDKITVVIDDKTEGSFVACSHERVAYLREFRKYNDLIVDAIIENPLFGATVHCHLSPAMKKAGFDRNDYIKKREA